MAHSLGCATPAFSLLFDQASILEFPIFNQLPAHLRRCGEENWDLQHDKHAHPENPAHAASHLWLVVRARISFSRRSNVNGCTERLSQSSCRLATSSTSRTRGANMCTSPRHRSFRSRTFWRMEDQPSSPSLATTGLLAF